MTITNTPVDNGINLQALLDARVALSDDPSLAEFVWRSSCRWENGTHTLLDDREVHRSRRRAVTPHRVRLRRRPPRVLRGRRPRADTGRVRARRPRRLPRRRRRVGRADAQHPAARPSRPRWKATWTSPACWESTRPCATASAPSPCTSRSMPTRRQDDIEALVAQAQKRSAVYDIIANPTNIVVDVNR